MLNHLTNPKNLPTLIVKKLILEYNNRKTT